MSLRNTKSNLRGRIEAGDFTQQDWSAAEEGIMSAANIYAKGILKKAEEKKEEEKRRAAAAARLAAEQRKKEEAAANRLRKAQQLAVNLGFDATNGQAISYFNEQLNLLDDNAAAVLNRASEDMEKGRLAQTPGAVIVEDVVSNDPTQPPPMRIDGGVGGVTEIDGRPVTSRDLPALAAEGNTEAAEMMDNFGPQQLAASETVAVENQQAPGLMLNPLAKPAPKIDSAFLKDNASSMNLAQMTVEQLRSDGFAEQADIVARYAAAEYGDKPLTLEEIGKLDPVTRDAMLNSASTDPETVARIEQWERSQTTVEMPEKLRELVGRSEQELRDIISSGSGVYDEQEIANAQALLANRTDKPFDIRDYANADTTIIRIALENSKEGSEMRQQLSQLLTEREQQATEAQMPNIADVRANNYLSLAERARQLGNDTLAESMIKLGEEYQRVEQINNPAERKNRIDALDSAASALARVQTDISKLEDQTAGYLGAVESAYTLNQIVQQNRDVGYFFGGTVPAAIVTVIGEISAVRSLLADEGAEITASAALTSIDQYEQDIERRLANGDISQAAAAYAMFQAQRDRLAFQIARMQQGPAGVISNQDFESARRQISASRNPDTFSDTLRGLIVRDEVGVNAKLTAMARNPQILAAKEFTSEYDDLDLTSGLLRTLEERITDAGLNDAYTWLKEGNPEITATPGRPVVNPSVEAINTMSAAEIQERFFDPQLGRFDYSGLSTEEMTALRARLNTLRNGGGN